MTPTVVDVPNSTQLVAIAGVAVRPPVASTVSIEPGVVDAATADTAQAPPHPPSTAARWRITKHAAAGVGSGEAGTLKR
ncbi:hypothetical protein [Nocardia sp. NPDC050717]|uniref:hypothetical protein n=1 Tax=Nocardia sp. NPDC050717 TaxID=3157221 RepID=UPI0033CE3710